MSIANEIHEEKETLTVDIFIPGHEDRVTTPLFSHTKALLIEREQGRCFVCGATAEESGTPLEAHHNPIERSLANMIDWSMFRKDCEVGVWGDTCRSFDWTKVDRDGPMAFVDDMTVNGMLLCKNHHTHNDEGIHTLPYPLWIAQKYGKEGFKFTSTEVLHHELH